MAKSKAVDKMKNADLSKKMNDYKNKTTFIIVMSNTPEKNKLHKDFMKKSKKRSWKKIEDIMKKAKRIYKKQVVIDTKKKQIKK